MLVEMHHDEFNEILQVSVGEEGLNAVEKTVREMAALAGWDVVDVYPDKEEE